MNDEDLPFIAERAMNSVLRYHDDKHPGISFAHLRILSERIKELLPLRRVANNLDAANVEIVCDAAMSCLDLYNREHKDNPVEEKWMYIGVQCLACLDLKPSLVRGRAPRLPAPNTPGEAGPTTTANDNCSDGSHATPQNDGLEDHSASGSRATTVYETPVASTPALKRDSSTQDYPASSSIADEDDDEPEAVRSTPRTKKRRSTGPQVANGKEAWGDEEISKLIKWKAQGMTHKEIGAILGRTEPACAIRHSIVLKQDKWINFARGYREKRAAGEASDDEGEPAKEHEEIAPAEDEQVDSQATEFMESQATEAMDSKATEVMETPQQLEEGDFRDDSSRDEDPKDDDYKE